jgi:hypothetical protein
MRWRYWWEANGGTSPTAFWTHGRFWPVRQPSEGDLIQMGEINEKKEL